MIPFAFTAANIAFSVAPTLGNSKLIVADFKFSLKHFIYPFFSYIFIPNFLSAFKCKSIGLDPIAHPPG